MTTHEPQSVSVVIPCYNQARFLGEAIESVLRQGYPHVEVVVVDDGSPDNIAEVVARYPQVRVVQQENSGLAAARNAGLRESQGEYVVFLDADDVLLPDALVSGVKSFATHPECAFVYGHCVYIADDGSPLPTPRQQQQGEVVDHYETLLRFGCHIWVPAIVMFRRAILTSAGGFNCDVNPSADYDSYLRLARVFPVHCHGKAIAAYRQHGASMSRNAGVMLKHVLTVHRAQRSHVKGNERYEEAYRKGLDVIRHHYGELIVESMRTNTRARRWRRATGDLLTLTRCCPRDAARHVYRKLRNTVAGKGTS